MATTALLSDGVLTSSIRRPMRFALATRAACFSSLRDTNTLAAADSGFDQLVFSHPLGSRIPVCANALPSLRVPIPVVILILCAVVVLLFFLVRFFSNQDIGD